MPRQIPAYTLEIAPGARANDANPAWSTIASSSRLQNFRYRRGKQYELDQMQAGSASFQLDNRDRVLDPTYTVGPFYGKLRANMQIRMRATISGTTYDLFRGHVQRNELSWSASGPQKVGFSALTCVDRLTALTTPTVTGDFDEELTGSRILNLLAAAGWPTSTVPSGWQLGTSRLGSSTYLGATVPLNSLDAGRATVAAATLDNEALGPYLQKVADSEPGLLFVDGSGYVVFLDRSRFTPSPAAAALTLTDNSSLADATHVYYDPSSRFSQDLDRIFNDVTVETANQTKANVADTESVDFHWRRPLSRSTLLRPADERSDAFQLAGWTLFSEKGMTADGDPVRVSTVSVPLGTPTAAAAILGLEIGDRLTVTRNPGTTTPAQTMTFDVTLEGIEVSGDPNLWTATLQLAPLPSVAGGGFKLGTSRLGTSARLVYA